MPRYIALLRAVNVGGAHTVKMDMLRQVFEAMGFSNVSSYIASGNIIFESPARNASVLEDRIEQGLMQAFGYEMTPFVRTTRELAQIAAFKPFPASRFGSKDQLGIIFLSVPPAPRVLRTIKDLQTGTDEWRSRGRELYWLRHRNENGEVYSTVPLEKALDQPFTIRGANTVQKLAEKYCGDAGS